MINKREVKPILHRQKCKNCDFYTVYQAVPVGEKAIDTCTHCQYAVEIPWDHEIKAAFKNKEKFLKGLEEFYPEIAELKNPGDHISLDD
jgi:hypothetical protein